jgi:hypothetical protein
MKELLSNKHMVFVFVLASVIIVSLLSTPVSATPPSGLHPEPVASGVLPEKVRAKFKAGEGGFTDGTDLKNIMLYKYTLDPGGTFGWHQHAGPVWAIITSGILSIYDGDDSTCTPHFYGAGSALLDEGTHTHLGVNETDEPVEIYATFMLPEGGEPRLDAEDPGVCN